MKTAKKVFSLLLCLVMLVSSFVALPVMAEEGSDIVELKATYDTYISSGATSTNYSTDTKLFVKSENGSPIRRSYLLMDTSETAETLDVSSIGDVKLRLYCTLASDTTAEKANRMQYRLYAFTDYEWADQTAITWSNKISSDTMELVQFVDASNYVKNTWVEIDVTEYVKKHWGEAITFELRNYGPKSNDNHLYFSSLETGDGNEPRLSICTADHTAVSGTPVAVYAENDAKLSVYKCTCGGQWAYDQNGVHYRGESVYKVCEKYTLWTATDGSYRTYKTDAETLADHTLETNGRCSACQEWTYINYSFINSPAVRELKKVTGLSTPAYDATNEWLSAPQGGAINMYTGMATKSESNITPTPFIVSFDFSVSAVLEGDDTKATHWPLLRYRGNADGTSTTNKTTTLLSIGATGTVATDATETSERIYLLLGMDHTFADGEADAIYYLEKDEWYNIQIAVDTIARSYRVYVNGEFVGAVKRVTADYMYSAGLYEDAKFMFGFYDGIAYRYNVGYNLDNISVTKIGSEYIHDLAPTNELIKINYETESLTQSAFGNNTWEVIAFGSHTKLRATEIVTDGTDTYGIFSGTANFGSRISMTSVVNGEDISPLENGKYEIKAEFAVKLDENGEVYSAASSKTGILVRLSKYNAEVKSDLVGYSATGCYTANGVALYNKNGEALSAARTFTDGVLEGTSKLQVIVDEDLGLYSIYVDNAPAYFYENEALVAFIDQPMPLNATGAIKGVLLDQLGIEWNTDNRATLFDDAVTAGTVTYGDVTKEIITEAGATLSNKLQSIFAFNNLLEFAVKEITVTEIPDENVTLVGVQQRAADATDSTAEAFDLRFVFGIDNLFVSDASFVVEAYQDGEYVGTQYISVDTAYSAILADGVQMNAWECVEGEYFVAFKIIGIEEISAESEYSFVIIPALNGQTQENKYWISCNGQGGDIQVKIGSSSDFFPLTA